MKMHRLNNGVVIPAIGLGTFRSQKEDAYKATLEALKIGYRHIDTASIYRNEAEVGRAIKDSKIPREELFITTKLWNTDQGYFNTKKALKRSLALLDLDYVDLYLLHWPKSYEKTSDSWQAMEELYADGLTKSIGVSNFNFHHLEHLFDTAVIMPVVNQVETHIELQNHKLHEFCMMHGIYLEAYAPLMSHHVKDLLANETLISLAEKHHKTPAQIALKYLYERDIIILPKSINKTRIKDNFEITDFLLDEEDLSQLRNLNKARKIFPEPDNIDY